MTTNQDRATQIINAKLIESCYPEDIAQALADAGLLAPDPQPRTLADMSQEEQDECRFMAAEVATGRTWYIIGRSPGQYGQWIVVTRSGRIETRLPEHIVPLPDLPRMVWPDEHYLTTDEDVSIIPPEIDTSTGHDDDVDMTPEDVPAGEAWIVTYLGEEWVGTRASHDGVWSLARMDGEACRYADDRRVTLVSRLVPEVEA